MLVRNELSTSTVGWTRSGYPAPKALGRTMMKSKWKKYQMLHNDDVVSPFRVDLPGKMEHPMGTSVFFLKHRPSIVVVKKGGHDFTLGVLEEFLHGLQCHTVPQEKHPLQHAQGRASSSRTTATTNK